MASRVTVVEVRDDVTVLRCECEGLAPTMHTILNTYIAAGNLQAEIDRITAETDARATAKAAAAAAVNSLSEGN